MEKKGRKGILKFRSGTKKQSIDFGEPEQSTKSPDKILYEIAEELKLNYGLIVKNAEANDFGFANLKWNIDTDAGIFFVKQYNSERYTNELLSHVEVALGLQDRLNKEAGIPCPTILPHKGSYIQRTSSGERFMLTEFCHGHMAGPGEVNKIRCIIRYMLIKREKP